MVRGSVERGGCHPKLSVSRCALLCLPAGGQPASPGAQGVRGQPGELQEAVCPQAVEGVSGLRGGGLRVQGTRWAPRSFLGLSALSHWQALFSPSLSSLSASSPCVTT